MLQPLRAWLVLRGATEAQGSSFFSCASGVVYLLQMPTWNSGQKPSVSPAASPAVSLAVVAKGNGIPHPRSESPQLIPSWFNANASSSDEGDDEAEMEREEEAEVEGEER